MTLIKAYYLLTKPGIIYSNVFTAIGGFFLAERGNLSIGLFLAMIVGLGLVIASACAFNNYIDRNIDAKMSRTKKRAIPTKTIPPRHAIIFATIVGIVGFSLLFFYTTVLAGLIAFIGFIFYVVFYSIEKRRSEFGTIVGSVSGAVPPVVGYCAVTGTFDIAAFLLFLVLVFWQMPHFYAIAIFRKDDYNAASIPILPLKKGIQTTKEHIIVYILAYLVAVSSLTAFGYTGYTFLIVNLVIGIMWFGLALNGLQWTNTLKWARRLFFFSLVIIVVFSLLLVFNNLLR
jgi:protoheme IX farnesyltransferase